MAVNITFSITDGGTALTQLACGAALSGTSTQDLIVYVAHDGSRSITNCGFYIEPATGRSYAGSFTANDDYNEVVAMGNSNSSSSWGGIQYNMDAIGGFSGGGTWDMSVTQKTSLDGLKFTIRTGAGLTSGNAVPLKKETTNYMIADGILPAGVTDAHFKVRVKIPTSTTAIGLRDTDQVFKYTYTS